MTFYTYLLAVAMAVALAQDANILNFSKMPACARHCDMLLKLERNCLHANSTAGNPAFICVCKSPELHLLPFKGYPCLPVCNTEEGELIHLYLNNLCEQSEPATTDILQSTATTQYPTSSFTSPSATSLPTTLSTVPNGPTRTIDPPLPSTLTTDVKPKGEVHKTWAFAHSKYLIIAGAMIGATLAALLLAAFILHHRHRKAQLERTFQQNGLIPLQPLSPRQTPLPPSPRPSEEGLPATVPSSPLATSPSSHSFGDTLRAYDQDELERERAIERRDALRKFARAMAEGNQAT